jgi:predicted PurR-regulated permease PerM
LDNKTAPPIISRSHLVAVLFFVFFLFLLYQMAGLLAPFSSALIWAAILALALHPLHERMVRLCRGNAGVASAAMTGLAALVIIGPAIALLTLSVSQAIDLYQWTSEGIRSGTLLEDWGRMSNVFISNLMAHPMLAGMDLKGMIMKSIGDVSSNLAAHLGMILKDAVLLGIDLVVMLVSLYFFFRHGDEYYRTVMDLLPFSHEHKRSISQKVHDTVMAVVRGVFLIALLQGLMTGIGFALVGLPYSVFWGFVASALALLPIGGAALVWVPGAVFLYLTGAQGAALALAAWGLILVSLPDNFLKPVLIGKKANLPTFFLFVGILGILFGPLIVTLLFALVRIYKEEYGGA